MEKCQELIYTAQLRTPRRLLKVKGSAKKYKKIGKYFFIVHIGFEPLTSKRNIEQLY